ncbi:MAG: ATP-binding protein [Deltaproteobacteria bacterium]|nr:ATP-binding protein [Deltaproteobacteria bacterium]
MSASDVEILLEHLRNKTADVELDLPPASSSATLQAAAQHARSRRESIRRGERAAYAYVGGNGDRRRILSVLVNADQSFALARSGARWVGPSIYAPTGPILEGTRVTSQVHLVDFKGHVDTNLELGRFTMLVGDNASGKTSVLEALEILSLLGEDESVLRGERSPSDLVRYGAARTVVEARGTWNARPWELELIAVPGSPGKVSLAGTQGAAAFHADATNGITTGDWRPLQTTIGRARVYALRSDRIAAVAHSEDVHPSVGTDGTNTALVLGALKLESNERFDLIEEAMRRLVPSLRGIQIRRARYRHDGMMSSSSTVIGDKLYFDFVGGTGIPAHAASHGTLVALSLLTMLFSPSRPNLVLLDDIDHALHPRAQKELMQTLLKLLVLPDFADLQIVATTHSPYILDELEPSDVYAFALRDDGTVASRSLAEHPEAAKTTGALTAGQLWSLDSERSWVLSD